MANCCISFPFLHLFVGVDSTQKWPFPWRLFVQEQGWEAGTGCLKGLAVLFVALLAMFTQTTARFSAFGLLHTLGSSLAWTMLCVHMTNNMCSHSLLRSSTNSGLKILWQIWKQVRLSDKEGHPVSEVFLLSASNWYTQSHYFSYNQVISSSFPNPIKTGTTTSGFSWVRTPAPVVKACCAVLRQTSLKSFMS